MGKMQWQKRVAAVVLSAVTLACGAAGTVSAQGAAVEVPVQAANTGLYRDDQVAGVFDLGFSFNYYGAAYTRAYVSTNGLLSFTNPSDEFENSPLSTSGLRNTIAAFWDDLVTQGFTEDTPDAGRKTIYYATVGTAPNREFIVQWTNEYYYNDPSMQMGTFQAILYEGSNQIQLQYRTLIDAQGLGYSYGRSATIGIIGQDAGHFVQHSCNQAGAIHEGEAIRFTPDGSGGYTENDSAVYEPYYLSTGSLPTAPQLIAGTVHDGATNVPLDTQIAWNAVSQADSYQVYVSTSPDFASSSIFAHETTAGTSYHLQGLAYGTTYYLRLEADNEAGSTISDSIRFSTVAAPAAPVTGKIAVTVTDGTKALSGASVKIGGKTLTTDANGKAEFDSLPVGSYTYTVSLAGYGEKTGTVAVTAEQPNQTVSVSLTATPVVENPHTGGGSEAPALILFAMAGLAASLGTLAACRRQARTK